MDRLLIKIGGNWHYKIFGRIVLGSNIIFCGAVLPKYKIYDVYFSKQFPPNLLWACPRANLSLPFDWNRPSITTMGSLQQFAYDYYMVADQSKESLEGIFIHPEKYDKPSVA